MGHIHEKIDFTAEVFVVYKNKILLRKHDKLHIWLSVGGHIELDEDPNEAAVREVKEEVGLNVKLLSGSRPPISHDDLSHELILPIALNRHPISETHEHITFVYFATADTDVITLSELEKSDDCRWFSKEDLVALDLRPNIRSYANLALDTIKV